MDQKTQQLIDIFDRLGVFPQNGSMEMTIVGTGFIMSYPDGSQRVVDNLPYGIHTIKIKPNGLLKINGMTVITK